MAKYVSVVGNGPSPAGQGWGAEIDGADTVIRLHDCHYQTDTADYGTRYDHGVLPGPWVHQAVSQLKRWPDCRWWYVYHFGTLPDVPEVGPLQNVFVNLETLNREVAKRGRTPSCRVASLSRGFCALMIAHGFGRPVVAFGFDALATEGRDGWDNPAAYNAMVKRDMAMSRIYNSGAINHDAAYENHLVKKLLPGVTFK